MRRREHPRRPVVGALAYNIDGTRIYLLRGDPYKAGTADAEMSARLTAVADADESIPVHPGIPREVMIGELAGSLLLKELWDDCEIEYAPTVDPDAIPTLTGRALWDAAEVCRADIYAPSTQRLGLSITAVTERRIWASYGWDDERGAAIMARIEANRAAKSTNDASEPSPGEA